MKKLFAILLALPLLLGMTACGEPEGITITNALGVGLSTVEVLNDDGEGIILPAGIGDGESDTVYLRLDGGEGYMHIHADDREGNAYDFVGVYLYDGTDVTLQMGADSLLAVYTYRDAEQQYVGTFTAAAGDALQGEWLYSDQENILTFDGAGGYTWQTANGTETGSYTFDGTWVEFAPSSAFVIGWTRASIGDAGHLCVEGDAGSYYYKNTN